MHLAQWWANSLTAEATEAPEGVELEQHLDGGNNLVCGFVVFQYLA